MALRLRKENKSRMRFSFADEELHARGWRRIGRRQLRFPTFPDVSVRCLTRLPIRSKLVLAQAAVVFVVVILLVWLTLGSYRTSLERRVYETCLLIARQLAESELVKANLLTPASDELANAELEAHVLGLSHLGVEGLRYAFVADRLLKVRAHSDFGQLGKSLSDSSLIKAVVSAQPTFRTRGDILEIAYPVVARRPREDGSAEPVVVGMVAVGLSRNAVFQPLYRSQRAALLGLILVFMVSGLLIFYVSKKMTQQVDHLAEGIRRVGSGDLNTKIQVLTDDELGTLAREFNRMLVSLREKLEMQKYVSPLTVQMIHRKTMEGLSAEVSRLPQVTVLFSDVREFSKIADRLPPRQVVEILNVYLDLQARAVEKHGGIVDKFVGDQVMAVFLGPNQVRNALATAQEIQFRVAELNQERQRTGLTAVEVGIGIHTGPAVAGSVGSRDRKDHTVLGDVVNVAFRLCSMARPAQILVTQNLAETAENAFDFTDGTWIEIKGKSEPLRVRELVWKSTVAEAKS